MIDSEIKVVFTVAIVVVDLVILLLITPRHVDIGKWWIGGKDDLFRRMLYDSDNRLRRHARLGIVGFHFMCLLAMWTFA